MSALGVGFTDPVHESRAWFRELMDATARPGSVRRALPVPRTAPPPLAPIAGALLLTLADADTPLWLSPALRSPEGAKTWLQFHTGASFVANEREAIFAVARGARDCPSLESLAQGEEAYPDRSATLLLGVDSLDEADGGADGEATDALAPDHLLVLDGPGIATHARLAVRGLPSAFVAERSANRARFPLGVDVVLIAADAFACLPRTTRVAHAATAAS